MWLPSAYASWLSLHRHLVAEGFDRLGVHRATISSVQIGPGNTALARMPLSTSSLASPAVKDDRHLCMIAADPYLEQAAKALAPAAQRTVTLDVGYDWPSFD